MGLAGHLPGSATAASELRFTGFTRRPSAAAPVGPPPAANVAPTAAFTATADRPDRRRSTRPASTDTDGTVAGYAWNFGDGAHGRPACHGHAHLRGGGHVHGDA